MRFLLFTLLFHINQTLKPFLSFPASALFKQAKIIHAPSFTIYPLLPVNMAASANVLAIRRSLMRVDKVRIFTKRANPNKLYIDNNSGIFLSAGIVLKFINLGKSRFLKKRLRAWYGYIKALQLLQRKPFVLHFSDLSGKKSILLNKIRSSGTNVAWALIKLFRNQHTFATKRSRRIKRWIRKKYYQLEIGEKR